MKILVIEDSKSDYEYLLLFLRKAGFDFTAVRIETAEELRSNMAESEWDIVISDNNLPTFDARQALTMVRKIKPQMPFIIVSGTEGEAEAVAAMKLGANNYISKNDLERLAGVVEEELRSEADPIPYQEQEEERFKAIHSLAGDVAMLITLIKQLKEEEELTALRTGIDQLEQRCQKLEEKIMQQLNGVGQEK